MSAQLRIDVGFDFVCPWCLIGLRNLQEVLRQLGLAEDDPRIALRWRGVQLLPTVPAGGLPFMDFYRRRLGGDAAVRQRQAQVSAAAAEAGVLIDYERIDVMPNTADAHRLLAYADGAGSPARRDALLLDLMRAYFERGEDLGDIGVLLAYGCDAGYPAAELSALWRGANHPYADAGAAGAGGVPSFFINGSLALSGARAPAELAASLRAALDADGAPA